MPNVVLGQLWQLARQEAQRLDTEPELVFDPIGLILHQPLTVCDYTTTPLNSSTFARTGGDGVHYGLLHINHDVRDTSPVVMTIPMAFEHPHVIVGASLFEFLCLGCEVGYAYLEELSYNRQASIDWIRHPQKWEQYHGPLSERQEYLRSLLVQEFDLKPWHNIGQRLDELRERYMPLLELQLDD